MESSGERSKLLAAIKALEDQRALLGDAVVDPAIAGIKDQIAALSPAAFEAEGERKLVTVMFADASGFTAMSEANDPEYVRNLINGCFEALVPVVEAHGGTIDKFIGDAIMALFGAPVAREDDAERAVRASLAMMKALDTFNRANNVKVGLHFGINTGEVIAGKIGAAGRRDYSVIGDAVNVAARLQDLSKRGQIFVGPETHRLTAAAFEYEAMDAAALKGRESPVPVFRLIGPKRKPVTGLFWKTSYDNPMVGREAEIERLAQAAIDLRSRREGRAFIVSGDAGVGKSRLLAEARRAFGVDFAWLQGRAQSHFQNASYATERELLFGLIGATVDTGPAEAAGLLLGSCHKLMGDEADEVYAHLILLCGLPVDEIAQQFVQSVSGDALRPRIAKAFLRYVMAWAGKRPLALCFEDIHWVDGASLELVSELGQAARTAPMVLILTSRSEALREISAPIVHQPHFAHIPLSRLDNAASEALIRQFLKCDALSPQTLKLVDERGEGNPFFIEEMLRSLVETGALTVVEGKAEAQPVTSKNQLPSTLQGVILARVDRLPAYSKSTLQTASVIGRSFAARLLAFVHQEGTTSTASLSEELSLLQAREFLRKAGFERESTEEEYSFQHALTQEVVYRSLLNARRTKIHLSIAETLEHYFGERSDEFSPALALHYGEAGEHFKSAEFHVLAARKASSVFSFGEARAAYQAALEQLAKLTSSQADPSANALLVQAHIGLGDVLEQSGDHVGAQSAYDQAHEHCDDDITRAGIHRKYGLTLIAQRESFAGLERYGLALAALNNEGAATGGKWWYEWIEIQLERMWAAYWIGDAPALEDIIGEMDAEVNRHGTLNQQSRFLKRSILVSFRQETLNISDATLRRVFEAMKLANKCNDPDDLCRANYMVGCCHMLRGDLSDALPSYHAAIELAEHVGNTEYHVMTASDVALVYRKMGDVELTRQWSTRALELASLANMPLYRGMAQGCRAWVALRDGNPSEAFALAAEICERWAPLPFQLKWIAAWPLLAAALDLGRLGEMMDVVVMMVDASQNKQPHQIMCGLKLCEAALARGDLSGASAALATAIPLAQGQGYI